jgi:hypothetical protein
VNSKHPVVFVKVAAFVSPDACTSVNVAATGGSVPILPAMIGLQVDPSSTYSTAASVVRYLAPEFPAEGRLANAPIVDCFAPVTRTCPVDAVVTVTIPPPAIYD